MSGRLNEIVAQLVEEAPASEVRLIVEAIVEIDRRLGPEFVTDFSWSDYSCRGAGRQVHDSMAEKLAFDDFISFMAADFNWEDTYDGQPRSIQERIDIMQALAS